MVLVENGQIPGMCALAHVFQHGTAGVGVDLKLAVQLWRRDISSYGCNVARFSLAEVVAKGDVYVDRNPALAKVLFENVLVEEASPQAAKRLAKLLMSGADGFIQRNPARAMRLYQWVIDEYEDVSAMCSLGDIFREGAPSVSPDPHSAFNIYHRASSKGSSRATNSLAVMVELGFEGCAPCPQEALRLYKYSIQLGDSANVIAMTNLSSLLLDGVDGVPRDPVLAASYLRKADIMGHADATWCLAKLLQKGDDGVPMDHYEAVRLYEKMLEHDSGASDVKFELAWLLSGNSDQLDSDYVRAVKLYDEVLEVESNVCAMLNMANILAKGQALGHRSEGDRKWAIDIYQRAIDEHDDVNAMIDLGLLLCRDTCDGNQRDVDKGLELLNKALHAEHVDAKFNLALILTDTDDGTPIDMHLGMKLYEEDIAETQNMNAMINLAELLREESLYVTRDIPRSIELCERAIAQGFMNNEDHLSKVGIKPDKSYEVSSHPGDVKLREQAIQERSHLLAIGNLADTLVLQADEPDYDRALSLFELALKDSRASMTFEEYTIDVYFKSLKSIFEGVRTDERLCRKAVGVYDLAVGRTGSTQVMCLLAEILMEGAPGVPRDTKKALCLYSRAAFNEDPSAMLTLGEIMTVGGPDIRVDRRYAVQLFAQVVGLEEEGVLATKAILNLLLMFQDRRRLREW